MTEPQDNPVSETADEPAVSETRTPEQERDEYLDALYQKYAEDACELQITPAQEGARFEVRGTRSRSTSTPS